MSVHDAFITFYLENNILGLKLENTFESLQNKCKDDVISLVGWVTRNSRILGLKYVSVHDFIIVYLETLFFGLNLEKTSKAPKTTVETSEMSVSRQGGLPEKRRIIFGLKYIKCS